MILITGQSIAIGAGAPRVCGDDPYADWVQHLLWECSPRMRG